jgi:hypothetical protein
VCTSQRTALFADKFCVYLRIRTISGAFSFLQRAGPAAAAPGPAAQHGHAHVLGTGRLKRRFRSLVPGADLPPRRASSYLQLRHDLLRLAAPGGLWIDVEAFLAAAREAHERRCVIEAARAEALIWNSRGQQGRPAPCHGAVDEPRWS